MPPIINGHAGQQHPISNVDFSSHTNKSRLIKTNVTNANNDVLDILNEPIITTNFENNDLVAILIKKQPHTTEQATTITEKETAAVVTQLDESSTKSNLFETLKTTLNSPLFTSVVTEEKTLKPHTTKMKKVLSVSTPDTVKTVTFTSGHQNNFGVPIEEDERVLKMLNDYQKGQKGNKVCYDFISEKLTTGTSIEIVLPIVKFCRFTIKFIQNRRLPKHLRQLQAIIVQESHLRYQ